MPQPFIARCWIYKTWETPRSTTAAHRPFPATTDSPTVDSALFSREQQKKKSLSRCKKKKRTRGKRKKRESSSDRNDLFSTGSGMERKRKKRVAWTECRWIVDSSDWIEGLHFRDAAVLVISTSRDNGRKEAGTLRENEFTNTPVRLLRLKEKNGDESTLSAAFRVILLFVK